MAVGANIKYVGSRNHLWALLYKILGNKRNSGPAKTRPKICYKAGVPANNTSADFPNELQDICIDTTNSHVYIATAGDLATTCTWTKIDA
jgi:hypothetical protein